MRAPFVLSAALVLGACDSDNTGATAPASTASSKPSAPPRVIVQSNITGTDCGKDGATVNVGTFGTDPAPVEDGTTVGDAPVKVTCSILRPPGFGDAGSAVRSGFVVDMTMTHGADKVHVAGNVDEQGKGTIGTTEVSVGGAAYTSATCTVDASAAQHGIALGRYWGALKCLGLKSAASASDTCSLDGEIRFENCTQQ